MMRKRNLWLLLVAISVVGCNSGSDGAATPDDKKNLDNLIQHGVGTSGGAGGAAKPPANAAPVGGKVDPP